MDVLKILMRTSRRDMDSMIRLDEFIDKILSKSAGAT